MPRKGLTLTRRLMAALDRLEPTLAAEIGRVLARLQRRIKLSVIVDVLERGDEFRLRSLVRGLSADLTDAANTLTKAFVAGQKAAVAALPEGITAQLNLTNPFVVRAAEASAARMVTAVSDTTRQAIRAVVARAVSGEFDVRDAAQLIRPLVGLTERQANAVIKRRFDLLAKGMPAARVDADAAKYAAKLLKQRATMIARTEIIRASTDGQIATWQQAQQQGFLGANPGKRWMVTPDDRLCPRCEPLDGEVVPMNASFSGGVVGPPLHPQCRCALILVANVNAQRGRAVA